MYSILDSSSYEVLMAGDNPLGDYIVRRRQELGFNSQREFAKKAGVSHSWLGNIERGFDYSTGKPTNPSTDKLDKVAKVLGVHVQLLVDLARGVTASLGMAEQLAAQEDLIQRLTAELDQLKSQAASNNRLAAARDALDVAESRSIQFVPAESTGKKLVIRFEAAASSTPGSGRYNAPYGEQDEPS